MNTCVCNPGYTLGTDTKTCADDDECAAAATNDCAATAANGQCTNKPGTFECSCLNDYILGPNNECVGKGIVFSQCNSVILGVLIKQTLQDMLTANYGKNNVLVHEMLQSLLNGMLYKALLSVFTSMSCKSRLHI